MGSTCSTIKKSTTSGSNERKESAESIPYGQSTNTTSSEHAIAGNVSTGTGLSTTTTTATATARANTATEINNLIIGKQQPNTTTTSTSYSLSSYTGPPPPSPLSSLSQCSPIPPATSPSPVALTTSGSTSAAAAAPAYQNISPTKGHLNLSQFSATIRASSYTQLFYTTSGFVPLDTNDSQGADTSTENNEEDDNVSLSLEDFYIIAISTESDELSVWSIYHTKPIRTIRNIPRPREVRMIDHRRAVVLCDRELSLFDLNSCCLITKLQGVMNQKMPYYGLHSEKSVVALSRNRMYVNLINLDKGHVETTFKAGEDRFLNSLLTSANGKMCVCGDETQKPFPLLVWDLLNRKLQYDLRIPKHEFITRLSAISDDGHYVVSVCQELNSSSPNHLVTYDLLSGTQFKKWKPDFNTVSVAISTRCGGCVINGMENNDILVWDLCTGVLKFTLIGHTAPPDLLQIAAKANVFLSYNSLRDDSNIRAWSFEHGTCLWTFVPKNDLSCCCLSPNGRALIFGHVGQKKLHLAIRPQNATSTITTTPDDIEKFYSHDEDAQRYIDYMRTKILPYGDAAVPGVDDDEEPITVDLKAPT